MKRIHTVILLSIITIGLNAQVTIGSSTAPNNGVLLDLKDDTRDLLNPAVTATKGLGMPRVVLINLNPDNGISLAASIGSTGDWDKEAHTGLIVYNAKKAEYDPATCKMVGAPIGLYVWEGSKWQGIGIETKPTITDPGEGIVGGKLIDRDGNDYHIGNFGDAGTWMTENLRTTHAPGLVNIIESASQAKVMQYAYPNGEDPFAPPPLPGKRPLYVGKPATWTTREGLLYNWEATMNLLPPCKQTQGHGELNEQTAIIQGICPSGWHVPSDREYNELEKEISENAANYASGYPSTGHGGSWTEAYPGATNWRGTHSYLTMSATPTAGSFVGYSKASNNNGFDLLPTGAVYVDALYGYASVAYLWTSSSQKESNAWYRILEKGYAKVGRYYLGYFHMFSVRCKKDTTLP